MKGDGSSRKDLEAGPRHKGEPPGRQKTEGEDRGRGGRDSDGVGPAECKEGTEKDQGMVQGCGQPCTAAHSSYARADHGGAGQPLQLRTIPGREHTCHSGTGGGQ